MDENTYLRIFMAYPMWLQAMLINEPNKTLLEPLNDLRGGIEGFYTLSIDYQVALNCQKKLTIAKFFEAVKNKGWKFTKVATNNDVDKYDLLELLNELLKL